MLLLLVFGLIYLGKLNKSYGFLFDYRCSMTFEPNINSNGQRIRFVGATHTQQNRLSCTDELYTLLGCSCLARVN